MKDPKEFNYDYLLVISKFTVPNTVADQTQKEDRIFYRWEDDIFQKNAIVDFSYLSTFKEVNDDNEKNWI